MAAEACAIASPMSTLAVGPVHSLLHRRERQTHTDGSVYPAAGARRTPEKVVGAVATLAFPCSDGMVEEYPADADGVADTLFRGGTLPGILGPIAVGGWLPLSPMRRRQVMAGAGGTV